MIYRLSIKTVKDMLLNQISNNYFKSIEDEVLITKHLPMAVDRFEKCIEGNNNKYYSKVNANGEKEPYFDPLHTCQWALFLYLMANTIYKYENKKKDAAKVLCDKIYGQAKTISGCDIYYEVEMPEKFSFDNPIGSYMGRAKYGEGFSFTQGCTVNNIDGIYPVLGNNVQMLTGSRILGNSHIGNNCTICASTLIENKDIPDNSIVSGKSPNLLIEHKDIEMEAK